MLKSDKRLSETCVDFMWASDSYDPVCTAHLAEGRVPTCGVYLRRAHISKDTLVGKCQDFRVEETREVI